MSNSDVLPQQVNEAVARLRRARQDGVPCAPVRDLIGSADLDAAYAVQSTLAQERVAAGERVVGRKIGLTSAAVQAQLGVDRPDFGWLFADMAVFDDEVSMATLLQPQIEAEVAFVLGADLTDGPLDVAQVRGAVRHAVAALEVVDSRIAGWDISFGDTVADNASSGLFVLGDQLRSLDEVEPRDVEMRMTLDGTLVSTGSGKDCLGDPLEALAWLARTARDLGDPLKTGEIVLSGALGPMVAVHPGAAVQAEITGLGTVTANFARAEDQQ